MVYSSYVQFKSIDKVHKFVQDVSQLDGDFDLQSGKFIVDAKSILGVIALGLNKSIKCSYTNSDAHKLIEAYK